MHRRSPWLTRAWLLLLLLLLVPVVDGCDASGGSGSSRWTAQARVVTSSSSSSSSPGPATSDPPVGPRLLNQAVPPGPRRPAVAEKRARAGKPNPKLRETVVRATREARAEALAAKSPGKQVEKPLADARPWGLKAPPPAPARAAPAQAEAAPPAASARATVTAVEPAPPSSPAADTLREHIGAHDEAGVASPAPGPLDGIDWNVPVALLVGALAALLLCARRPS